MYPMLADIYYAEQVQKPSGEMRNTWAFDRTVKCELKTGSFNTEMRYATQTFDDFFTLPTVLYGRFKDDIQSGSDDSQHMTTEILVTNIRTNKPGDTGKVLFTEPNDTEDEQVPILYELRSLSPFINMWGRAEHYKTQLMRSDNQEALI